MTTIPSRPYPTGQPTGGDREEGQAQVTDAGPRLPLLTWCRSELRQNLDRFLLRNLARCGRCSTPMAPMRREGGARTYKCQQGCREHHILAQDLEAAVIDAVKELCLDFADLDPHVRASALEHLLARVDVGDTAHQITLWWAVDIASPADAGG